MFARPYDDAIAMIDRETSFEVDDVPTPPGPSNDRLRGMLLGIAIGDALGNTTESLNPSQRRERHGEVRNYLPNQWADDLEVGVPGDETQLAFWTVESLLEHGRLDPEDLIERFSERTIYKGGDAVDRAVEAYRYGASWNEAGEPSAGNGALARVAPTVLPHLPTDGRKLWEDVVFSTIITHKDEMAVVANVGFTGLLFEVFGAGVDEASGEWWVDKFLKYARPVETDREYPSRSPHISFQGTLCEMVETHMRRAAEGYISIVDACDSWYSGAYLLETVPSALLVLARCADDPEEALVRAVNDTRASDTIGATVGAAVGALHGAEAFPKRWVDNLTGRTREDDEGHVFELIDQAIERFGLRSGRVSE